MEFFEDIANMMREMQRMSGCCVLRKLKSTEAAYSYAAFSSTSESNSLSKEPIEWEVEKQLERKPANSRI